MGYDKYERAVLDKLEELPMEEADRETARRAVEGYFDQREGRLENLLERLEPGKDPKHRDWIDRAQEAAAQALKAFEGLKAPGSRFFLADLAFQEHRFFVLLSLSQLPVVRDRMVQQTANLRTAMQEFDRKWEMLRDMDNSIDDRLKRAAEQYEEALVSAAQLAAETEKQAKEKMASTVSTVIKGGLKLVDLGIVEKVISGAASLIGLKLSETQARKLEIFALLSREEQVIHSFRDGRHVVAEFLEDHSYAKIKSAWGSGEDAADAFAKQITVDGQEDDAAEFAKAAKSELEKVFKEAESEYKEFAKRHEYLFFGPLGSGYVQELSEIDTWKDKSRRWKDLREDFDDLLRERFLQVSEDDILDVSLDGIVEEDRERMYYALKDACQQLMRVWNQWKDFHDDPDFILENREQMQSILNALR